MGQITDTDTPEDISQKVQALAYGAWYQIIENHDVVVPVLVLDHEASQTVIRDPEKIRDELLGQRCPTCGGKVDVQEAGHNTPTDEDCRLSLEYIKMRYPEKYTHSKEVPNGSHDLTSG